jgi:hypothetical protein
MSVFSGMSKGERNRIKIRVRTAMAAQAKDEGPFLGGRPPYGYLLHLQNSAKSQVTASRQPPLLKSAVLPRQRPSRQTSWPDVPSEELHPSGMTSSAEEVGRHCHHGQPSRRQSHAPDLQVPTAMSVRGFSRTIMSISPSSNPSASSCAHPQASCSG